MGQINEWKKVPNKRLGWKICKSSGVEKVQVGWGKSKNANRVDAFIWHLRVNYVLEACRIFGNFCLVGQTTLQILIIFELDISFLF